MSGVRAVSSVANDFEIFAFGPALLNELRSFDGGGRILEKFETLSVGTRLHDLEFFQRRPRRVDELACEGFAVRSRVIAGDFESARQEVGCPACTDCTGADDAHPPHFFPLVSFSFHRF
jgi:hypothetical protein